MKQPSRAILKPMLIICVLVLGLSLVFLAVRLVTLQRLVAGYRNYWQSQAKQTAEPGALTYIALGDSGAQGIGASQPQKGYVGLLRTAIEEKTGTSVQMINISVSGAKVADVTATQIPQLADLKIDDKTIITLSIGGNDAVHRNPNFAKDVDTLFSQLPPQTIVADIGYFGGGRYRSRQSFVDQVNPQLHDAAAKHGLKVVKLHQVTKDRDSLRNSAIDIFHPSDRGYRNWFDAFWPAVQKQVE